MRDAEAGEDHGEEDRGEGVEARTGAPARTRRASPAATRVERVDADGADQRGDHQEAHAVGIAVSARHGEESYAAGQLLQPDALHDQVHGHDDRRGEGEEGAEVRGGRRRARRRRGRRCREGRASSKPLTPAGRAALPRRSRRARRRGGRWPPRSDRAGPPNRRAGTSCRRPRAGSRVPLTNTTPRSARGRLDGARRRCPRAGPPRGSSPPPGGTKRGVGEVLLERGGGGVAPLAERGLHGGDRAVDRARRAELGHDRLGHHARGDVGAGGRAADARRWSWPGPPGSPRGCRGTPSSRRTTRTPRCRSRRGTASWGGPRPRSAAPRRGRPRRS